MEVRVTLGAQSHPRPTPLNTKLLVGGRAKFRQTVLQSVKKAPCLCPFAFLEGKLFSPENTFLFPIFSNLPPTGARIVWYKGVSRFPLNPPNFTQHSVCKCGVLKVGGVGDPKLFRVPHPHCSGLWLSNSKSEPDAQTV